MNKQKWTFLLTALALIGVTALALVHMKANQKLGLPGIKTAEIPGSKRLNVYLPPKVLDFNSVAIPTDTNVLNGLPQDTSFAERGYYAPDGEQLLCNIVLMGTDRTSIHKPQFCLTGVGWSISDADSSADTIRVARPYAYDLPVMKLVTAPRELIRNGKSETRCGVYVYWFVADNELTESHWVRMRRMSTHLLTTGELQRWAYVSCFAVCAPSETGKTYEQMKKFIAASVPEFQLVAGARAAGPVSPQAALR
ncbi:MAG TPA: exosortase-associated EpsI family protein [Candidatus Cybelea sp.]|jgi:hypothetical protein|nr:exosortase-associated EpsI family protein [Candidatus Cybelea sp.]